MTRRTSGVPRRERDRRRRSEVRALPVLWARRSGTLAPPGVGQELVCVSVGPYAEAIGLWSVAADRAALGSVTTGPGGATVPDPRAPRPVDAVVAVHTPQPRVVARIPDLPLAHPTVQVLPGDRVLVVAARCRWRDDGPDRNAIVYAGDGDVLAERTLGDGIGRLQASAGGQVWVGYFDEGIFGNHGWGGAAGPEPVGQSGLVRFSPELQPEWHFPPRREHRWGSISDCYALNVDGGCAWVCYYSGFPVVRITGDRLTGWRNTLAKGVRALVVGETRVGLYGGYGPDRDRFLTAGLGDDELHPLAEHRVVLPDGSPVPRGVRAIGRGPTLHLFVDHDWYQVDLDTPA